MAKVKPDGPIWGLEFNQYVCFLFRGNRTIFGWDIANSIFDLEIESQGHGGNRPKSKQIFCRWGPSILPEMKEIKKVFQSYHVNKYLRTVAAAYESVQKHKVTPTQYTSFT